MKEYTKDDFFNKLDYEGGFEQMAAYAGLVEITDDPDLNQAWNTFVASLRDVEDIYEDWEETQQQEVQDD